MTTVLPVLLARFRKLLQRILFVLKLVGQILDTLARKLHLLLHAVVVLEGCGKLGEPELLSFFENVVELLDLAILGLYVAVLLHQLGLHVLVLKNADQFEDV